MTAAFTESVVEQAALAWLESVGWQVRNGAEIVPGEPVAERDEYGQVVLPRRLRNALARLNPQLPADALADAFRKLTRPEGVDLIVRNRALHRLLVDGVTVEYRDAERSIRGAQRCCNAGRPRSTRPIRAGRRGPRSRGNVPAPGVRREPCGHAPRR